MITADYFNKIVKPRRKFKGGTGMLVLTAKPGAVVHVGGGMVKFLGHGRGQQIKIGFEFPQDVRIVREELVEQEKGESDEQESAVRR